MPVEVVMPQMGESIVEGTITRWLKKAGDPVVKDEPLFEISTDKVDAEIPAPVSGVLSEIKAPEGATVQVNAVVAIIGEMAASTVVAAAAPSQAKVATDRFEPSPSASARDTIEIVMPQMGESIVEGAITKWLKQPGDTVAKDEPLFEISTDKVDAEIPAPVSGVLSEIRVQAGETVPINTVVAVIGGAGPATPLIPGPPPATAKAEPAPSPASMTPPAPIDDSERVRSSPLVRRMAKENHLNLRQIVGTGSEGRITKEDVLRHLSQHGPGSAAVQASPQMAVAPTVPQRAPTAQSNAPEVPQAVAPLTKMRAIIAQRMVESVQTSPHAYTVYKVDMSRVARVRERERRGFEQRNGVRLTYMPFIAAAAVETLRKFPIVNASLDNGFIRYHQNIHLGIAVALEWGLIVPVVKQAEERSFLGLARAIADLAERARSKKLNPDEASGSTFTLTNSGVFGGEFGTPIINQPEAAILAIGGLKKEAVVLTDAEGNDTIAIRPVQYFCLGFDHRLIDGADAGKFMTEFKKTLENWDRTIG